MGATKKEKGGALGWRSQLSGSKLHETNEKRR